MGRDVEPTVLDRDDDEELDDRVGRGEWLELADACGVSRAEMI